MKRLLFIAASIFLMSMSLSAQGLATVQVTLQLSSRITDRGTTVEYYKNGQRINEELSPQGLMNYFFEIDKNKGFEISFLIDGGNTLRVSGTNSSGEIENREIKYANPCTNAMTFIISEGYTNLIFTFTTEDW